MVVTKHAKQRMKKRCGLNEKSADRLAHIALKKGLHHKDLTGNLKKVGGWIVFQKVYSKQYKTLRR